MSTNFPSRRLNRREAAKFSTENGFKIAASTLAVMACRGDGPPFVKFGQTPLYDPNDLLAWAQKRLSKKVCSTAELSAFGVASPSTSADCP
jgi:hypothetical protein